MPLRYVLGQDDTVVDFVVRSKIASGSAKSVGYPQGRLKTIGIVNADNELIAGLVYFNYSPEAETIEMSVEALHGHHWLTPTTLAIMFQYPFLQCGCQLLTTRTLARYEHVLRMLAAINFSLICVPRWAGRNDDGILALLTREDWEASKFCQRYGHHLVDDKAQAA